MGDLVDTNVFSEPVKAKPDPNVIAWLREHESALYVSTITIGEIRRGIERLPSGRRKTQLQAATEGREAQWELDLEGDDYE